MCLLCAVFTHLLSEQSRKLSSSHNSACKIIRFWFLFFFSLPGSVPFTALCSQAFSLCPWGRALRRVRGMASPGFGGLLHPWGAACMGGGGFLQPPWGRGHELEKPGGNRDTNRKGQVIRGVAWTVSPYFTLPITCPAFSSPGLFYFLYRRKGSSLRDWFSLGTSRLLLPGRGLWGCSSVCPGLWGAMSTSDSTQESHCEAAWHQSFGGVTLFWPHLFICIFYLWVNCIYQLWN